VYAKLCITQHIIIHVTFSESDASVLNTWVHFSNWPVLVQSCVTPENDYSARQHTGGVPDSVGHLTWSHSLIKPICNWPPSAITR